MGNFLDGDYGDILAGLKTTLFQPALFETMVAGRDRLRPRIVRRGKTPGHGIGSRWSSHHMGFSGAGIGLSDFLEVDLNEEDLRAAEIVAETRPEALRSFDQIPMLAGDLARQAKLVRPRLAGKRVVFMGDNDATSSVLGLMGTFGSDAPSHMLLLDFDQRVLCQAEALARNYGYAHRLSVRAYNAFDPVPTDLLGQFDVFYTNPPYGSSNQGESARLFITRGIELCQGQGGACGCIILPDDEERPWTRPAMRTTELFLLTHGWSILEKTNGLHQYHLPNDPYLTSGMLWTADVEAGRGVPPLPHAGLRVPPEQQIAHFYGTKVSLPYPHYVQRNGTLDYDWAEGHTTN